MTEKQWLTGRASQRLSEQMLATVRGASERKFRLLLCELMRQIPSATEQGGEEAIALGELWADRQVTDEEVVEFGKRTFADYPSTQWTVLVDPAALSLETCTKAGGEYWSRLPPLFRECFGNPFRPAKLEPAWLTSTVLALAEGIYAEKAFDRMPILADALQDAGCDNDDILSHCRDTSLTHVRGCWVIDLLTGRG